MADQLLSHMDRVAVVMAVLCSMASFVATESSARGQQPRVLDEPYALQLVAQEPDIVTPIGMTFDRRGRLLVIESHTHFRPSNYEGPAADRIRILEDTDADGAADRFGVFWEGSQHAMSLATHADGSIYLATRSEILRLFDDDKDGVADRHDRIVWLDTVGNYPHNGLCGLCFDGEGRLIFGLGENLGADYQLIGSDGCKLVGGGEGGNVYRCHDDGSHLERLATGFWNPFGICVDVHGRIFAVDNDPDSRPPCRLLHVVPGGDYGYQFRYGRSGRHPLQSWEGELPGTLGLVAGTGEAPSAVLPYEGQLWVTSWGDHRIERYGLVSQGASWRAVSDLVLVGGETFRPVALIAGPDGALYFSDWVDRSYELHGRGRVWKLTRALPGRRESAAEYPSLSPEELRAAEARGRVDWEAASSEDPFLWQAAVWGLVQHGAAVLQPAQMAGLKHPRQRLAAFHAARWKGADAAAWIEAALADVDPDVRLAAVRWVADAKLGEFRSQVEGQLKRGDGSGALYRAAAASISWLERGQPDVDARQLLEIALDAERPTELRVWALRLIPPGAIVERARWLTLLNEDEQSVQREAVWALSWSAGSDREELLEQVVHDGAMAAGLRADAVVGLSHVMSNPESVFERLLGETVPPEVRREALRGLGRLPMDRAIGGRPERTDVEGWLLASDGAGDREAGRRVFFHDRGGRCSLCHSWQGQGQGIGPDLSGIGKRMSRRRLIESILFPNREVAPQYKAFLLETEDGQVLTGVTLGQIAGGEVERFVDSSGREFELRVQRVVSREMLSSSIMPEGLVDTLMIDDMRNLLAFLGAE